MYLCTAESAAGAARAHAVLEVEPREAPQLEIFPSPAQVIVIIIVSISSSLHNIYISSYEYLYNI